MPAQPGLKGRPYCDYFGRAADLQPATDGDDVDVARKVAMDASTPISAANGLHGPRQRPVRTGEVSPDRLEQIAGGGVPGRDRRPFSPERIT